MTMPTNNQLLSVIDLTRLENHTPEEGNKIKSLCEKAFEHRVAAVCVYSRYVRIVEENLNDLNIKIATVINFPSGAEPLDTILSDLEKALEAGAEEIDLVFPYQDYLKGEKEKALDLVRAVKKECFDAELKVILETGVILLDQLAPMARDVIDAGADFLKTSTGKVAVGATPEAVSILLGVIKEKDFSVGLKVSGGVRTKKDALLYWKLAEDAGLKMDPRHFRIGASGLLDELVK